MREFSLGAVLSITAGPLLCDMGEVYGILDYMTGEGLFTHQLPRAADACREPLLEQHPQLRAVDASRVNRDNWAPMLAAWEAQYGKTLMVRPLAEWKHIGALTELVGMVGAERVIPVVVGP